MNKQKISALILGGLTTAFWLYFNLKAALSENVSLLSQVIYVSLAVLFLIPLILAWWWPKIAGWFYILVAIFLGGGYYYIIFFAANNTYQWWLWITLLGFMVIFPLLAGLMLVKLTEEKVGKFSK